MYDYIIVNSLDTLLWSIVLAWKGSIMTALIEGTQYADHTVQETSSIWYIDINKWL